jgi:hypothetical protein
LLDSLFIDLTAMSHLWHKITHDSTIVHIRRVDNPERTLAHNARYAARPCALIKIPEKQWQELYDAFAGRRIVGTWKSAKKISLRPSKPENADQWKSIGSWSIVQNLKDSNEYAKKIWKAWTLHEPLEPDVNLNAEDDFLNGKNDEDVTKPDWEIEPYFDWSKHDY